MKKLISILFTLSVILSLSIAPAYADEEPPADAIVSYDLDKCVHAFLLPKNSDGFFKKRFSIEYKDRIFDTNASPKSLKYTDTVVGYMFLVDCSTSMPYYADRVKALAENVLKTEARPFSASVATFGEKFTLRASGLDTISKTLSAIDNISYTEEASEICNGVLDAATYLKDIVPQKTTLSNIIVMTDGDTYMQGTGWSEEGIAKAAQQTKPALEQLTEIVIHTVGFSDWNPDTLDAVSVSKGLDSTAYSADEAASVGKSIAEFSDSLYRVDIPFDILARRFDITLISTKENTYLSEFTEVKDIRNYDVKDTLVLPRFDKNGRIIKRKSTSEKATEKPTESATENPSENTDETKKSAAITSTDRPSSTETIDDTSADKNKGSEPFNLLPFIIIGAAVILTAAVIIIIIAASRKKNRNIAPEKAVSEKPSGLSITVIPEITSGNCVKGNCELTLNDELLIGSDKSCDIVFDDYSIAPKNTRIYLKNNLIYIEDINEVSNTYLSGMKLFAPNRLRSGDKITIGNASLRLKF